MQRDREEQAKLIQYQHHKYFLDTPAKKQALKYFEAMYGNISSQHTAELQLLLESALVREITNGAVIIPIVADMEVDWGEG
ncbi:MAG: hypothetical protein LBG59_04530 [Candidatus Peribacteria bacterium]|nr:hypothetical protein [Candidatus Peribacteria bacterium]